MRIDPAQVEEVARELYIRALKILPPDIKEGFRRLAAGETDATAKKVLGTMITNIRVAEDTENLLCQDTGIPMYNVTIGRGVDIPGVELQRAIRRGCERATKGTSAALLRRPPHHPQERAHLVRAGRAADPHRFLRRRAPADRDDSQGQRIRNNSWLKMAVPADGVDAIKTFVIDCVLEAGGKTCPPTIVGVGIGGTSDLCVALAKQAATRPLGTNCADAEGAALEKILTEAGQLAGRGTSGSRWRFHVVRGTCRNRRDAHHDESGRSEHAVPLGAARFASFTAAGVEYGF
jgi:fumarate hydratase subunit alpha/L(+)-tartrate dehydratase alpha subunit